MADPCPQCGIDRANPKTKRWCNPVAHAQRSGREDERRRIVGSLLRDANRWVLTHELANEIKLGRYS